MVLKHCLFEVKTFDALQAFFELTRMQNVDQITEEELDEWRTTHLLDLKIFLDTPAFVDAVTAAATQDPTDDNAGSVQGDWVHYAVFQSAFEFKDRGFSVKFPELTDPYNYYVAITFTY